MSVDKPFTKDNLDLYLKELAKEFRRLNGNKVPAEIILIGGASVLINYGFREMTYDIDAIIVSSSAMKDAINNVGDKMGLPYGWLNTDFVKTNSYTSKLAAYSKYYKTYSNILQIRTISSEYLVAMKLMAGRKYKNDLSDVIGILIEQERQNDKLSLERIKVAIEDLYGEYEKIPESSRIFIESVFEKKDLKLLYNEIRKSEVENKDILVKIEGEYPGVLNKDNLDAIINAAKSQKGKQ